MKKLLLTAAALGMMTGVATAQSSGGSTTTDETTTISPVVSVPVTTSSSITTGRGATADGDRTATGASSYIDGNGNRTETTVTNTTYPLTSMMTNTKKTTVIANGVATETVITTSSYPPSYNQPPVSTTASRTYTAGEK